MSTERATFSIRDEGLGFDTKCVPDPGDPESLALEGGHGLLLMQTFMDEVRFSEKGNEVTMVKLREGDSAHEGDS
jgi:anti-sigma regulatory factor (Ser/Thr protein kinase)